MLDDSTVDINQVIHDLESDDDTVRARVLRKLCPCRNAWDLFAQHRSLAGLPRSGSLVELGQLFPERGAVVGDAEVPV